MGDLLPLPLSSEDVRGSLRSKEAKAEGNARERVGLGRKRGGGDGSEHSSSVALEWDGDLVCAFFAFNANFDDRASAPGNSTNGRGSSACVVDRLWRDWYDVVMAVVAVAPFAIGVRYSVCDFGSSFGGGTGTRGTRA